MSHIRRAAAVAVVALAASLVACAPALPESVIPGTKVAVAWTGELTSVNAVASPTSGNRDIAEMIRADFGDVIDGRFVPDESFGTAEIISDDPFTVRYDLAEPSWSDGIPLDAADLLLGWAAASGYFSETDSGAAMADADIPAVDEFARAIEVTSPQPRIDWQRMITVAVPAHIVARQGLGLDDPMEAKQAIITAIQSGDEAALKKIADAWRTGFTVGDGSESGSDLLISSGPFRIDGVEKDGTVIHLVPNAEYKGLVGAQIAAVEFVPRGKDPLSSVGETFDVMQIAPTASNYEPIRMLERKDFTVAAAHDGTMWSLQLRPSGVFSDLKARVAFIHAVPVQDLVDRGAGEWTSDYGKTTSMVSAPGSREYDIVEEDSGFTETLGTPSDDVVRERDDAGVPEDARVCVLYDRGSEFASGSFAALREAAAEAGWRVADCGSDDYANARKQGRWDAVIARTPIPTTPEQIAAQWGSDGAASLIRTGDAERDELIAQFARTVDVYEAREVMAQIEASIVRTAVALPLAVNPRVTIADRNVEGVAARSGAVASLTYAVTGWAVIQR